MVSYFNAVNSELTEIIHKCIGMSIPTLSAARAYMGKLAGGLSGEETHLYFDDFPHTGLSKVRCTILKVFITTRTIT